MFTHQPNPLAKVQILIVEDDRIMRSLLRDMLQAMGFENIASANDGLQGVEYLQFHAVDIIVTDWKMQGMDGLAFTKFVREQMEGGKRFTPIIMLTGRSEERDVIQARDAGVTEYIIKPFTAQGLYDRIKSVIENPRGFVLSDIYTGPDRRRNRALPPDGQKKRETD